MIAGANFLSFTIFLGICSPMPPDLLIIEKIEVRIGKFILGGSNIGGILRIPDLFGSSFSAIYFLWNALISSDPGVGAWIFLPFRCLGGLFPNLRLAIPYGKKELALVRLSRRSWTDEILLCQIAIAGYLLFVSSFLFLIPYVRFKIRGIQFPGMLLFRNAPLLAWAAVCCDHVWVYSQIVIKKHCLQHGHPRCDLCWP